MSFALVATLLAAVAALALTAAASAAPRRTTPTRSSSSSAPGTSLRSEVGRARPAGRRPRPRQRRRRRRLRRHRLEATRPRSRAALDRSAVVAFAEPNFILNATATPNDPLYADEYGLNNTGQTGGPADADIDAPEGWDAAGLGAFPKTGGAKVGIVDTGIDQTHADLAGKTAGCATSYNNGIAVINGICADDNGHGTHVAGTITANTNNAPRRRRRRRSTRRS